ncbi:DUF3373 family protein [Deltaproteobacteria bacterium IMCC39524]|nr:DUF3373 family protein [Deltaproteobacteria bacterium IMCC39524]
MATLLALPMTTFAAGQEDAMISELQKQIQELSEELEELNDRVDGAERHATLDRIEFSGDLRSRAHSLHYNDVTFNPGIQVDFTDFFNKAAVWQTDPGSGAALNTLFTNLAKTDPEMFTMLQQMMGAYMMDPVNNAPGVGNFRLAINPDTSDINNDIMYDSRLRLNMKAKVWDNVKFSGRLAMYKNWGDSTNSQVFDSWRAFSMDGTNGGNTNGDALRVDRAYMDWSNIADTGMYLSIGRRPSTYGPPTEVRENELRGGTPTGNVMFLNFDGITVGRSLEDLTGIEGMVARFCYGQGFESEWGNGELFNDLRTTKDTHFAGFNFDLYNDGQNFFQTTIFTAQDINDGFKGTIAFPTQYAELFAPTLYKDMQKFPNFNFETRYQPSTTIGDINLAGMVFSRAEDNGIKWFTSVGWTQMRPNGNAGMFGGMGTDAVFEAELSADGTEIYMVPKNASEDKNRDGYGFYAGVQVPAPYGKAGLEYNYGSKYWTPFTQGQDDSLGSKLATRGHVGEAYYIFDINPKMFIKLAGLYYDFEYSNSGSPVGKPKKIDDIQDGTAYSLLPVIDTAYDLNASLTVQF